MSEALYRCACGWEGSEADVELQRNPYVHFAVAPDDKTRPCGPVRLVEPAAANQRLVRLGVYGQHGELEPTDDPQPADASRAILDYLPLREEHLASDCPIKIIGASDALVKALGKLDEDYRYIHNEWEMACERDRASNQLCKEAEQALESERGLRNTRARMAAESITAAEQRAEVAEKIIAAAQDTALRSIDDAEQERDRFKAALEVYQHYMTDENRCRAEAEIGAALRGEADAP